MISRRRVVTLLAAAPLGVPAARVAAQTASVLRIGSAATETYAEPYYAAATGIFTRAGINAEITTFPSASAIVQAMAGGAIDVAMADMIQVANGVVRGLPFAFFAGAALYTSDAPTTVLCVARTSAVRAAKDLEGGTVSAFGIKSLTDISTREWLRVNGADPERIKLVEIPAGATVAALLRGTVAAGTVGEPFLSSAQNELRVLGKGFDAVAKSFYIAAWFSRRDWLAQNAALARRLSGAIYETARWAGAHLDESATILANVTKLDVAQIRAMTRAAYGTSLEPRLLQPVLDVAARWKAIERPVSADELIARL